MALAFSLLAGPFGHGVCGAVADHAVIALIPGWAILYEERASLDVLHVEAVPGVRAIIGGDGLVLVPGSGVVRGVSFRQYGCAGPQTSRGPSVDNRVHPHLLLGLFPATAGTDKVDVYATAAAYHGIRGMGFGACPEGRAHAYVG